MSEAPDDRKDTLRVAAESECDPRSVASYFDGQDVRPLIRTRIERALTKLGMTDRIRKPAA